MHVMYIYIYKYNFKNMLKLVRVWVYLYVRAELEYITKITIFYISLFVCAAELEDRYTARSWTLEAM